MVKDAVTLLLGSETQLRDEVIRPLREKLFPDASSISLNEHRWDASREPLTDLLTHAQTAPFLADKRLLIIDHVDKVDDTERDAFLKAVRTSSQQHAVWILMTEQYAAKTVWLKSLAAISQSRDCSTPFREDQIKSWIIKRFKEEGKTADSRVAEVMLERVGKSVTLLGMAIEQLVIYRKDSAGVTAADAEALLGRSAEENAFEIISAAKYKGASAAIRIVRGLKSEGLVLQEILGPLGFQFDQLLRAKNCLAVGMGAGDIANRIKLTPYRANQVADLARRITPERMRKDLETLLDCEEKIKRGELEETEALEVCLLRLGEIETDR
jgi:DNA polymerase-3 subunit delta